MGRLIDRGELFNRLATAQDKAEIFSIINDMQTVDAVPVVRCKDCVQWFSSIGWCGIHSHITLNGDWNMFSENDYCSYGERRMDD